MTFLIFLFAFFLAGCRSKEYSSAYNMHVGNNVLMRYDPAAQVLVIQAESTKLTKYAKLKFSPPPQKLKSFAGKEAASRACVSKTDLGLPVLRAVPQWISELALDTTREIVDTPPKTFQFKVKSEIDDPNSEIPITVILTQEADRWTIIIRHKGGSVKPLATVVIDRAGSKEGIRKWKVDINEMIGEIMQTRKMLMSCIFSASR